VPSGFLLRLAGSLGYYLGRMVVNVYDLVIFPALWLEALILRKITAAAVSACKRNRRIDQARITEKIHDLACRRRHHAKKQQTEFDARLLPPRCLRLS
jgi:hypothetical protein